MKTSMKTLLRIDASVRRDGSVTRSVTDLFQESWLRANPGGRVIRRCLVTNPVPHLTDATLKAFREPDDAKGDGALSGQLIVELEQADDLVIGTPVYNLTLPSSLKAWFDQVIRVGKTFDVINGEYRGLLHNKSATLITARSDPAPSDPREDHQATYLRAALAFMGIERQQFVAMHGTTAEPDGHQQALEDGRRQVDDLFGNAGLIDWCGDFSADDRQQIGALRAGQADAIVKGDARAYAGLCVDDIQLLIPAHDLIVGRDAFLKAEETLFANASFANFRKFPGRVERSGNLAVETGLQEVDVEKADGASGVFASRQKYTHIFRRTPQGWRIALLMSNALA